MILTSDYILIITNGFPVELYPEVQLTGFKMSSSSQPTIQTECKQSGLSLVIQEYQLKTETNKLLFYYLLPFIPYSHAIYWKTSRLTVCCLMARK